MFYLNLLSVSTSSVHKHRNISKSIARYTTESSRGKTYLGQRGPPPGEDQPAAARRQQEAEVERGGEEEAAGDVCGGGRGGGADTGEWSSV